MRLLGIERQDLEGDLRIRHEERDHGLDAELLQRLQAVIAVRRQVLAVLADRDDRIEEPPERPDDGHELLHVRVGGVALVRRRLDAAHPPRRPRQRRAAEWIGIATEDGALVFLDLRREPIELTARDRLGLGRGKPHRRGRGLLAANGFLPRRHAGIILAPAQAEEVAMLRLMIAGTVLLALVTSLAAGGQAGQTTRVGDNAPKAKAAASADETLRAR